MASMLCYYGTDTSKTRYGIKTVARTARAAEPKKKGRGDLGHHAPFATGLPDQKLMLTRP